MSGLFFNNRKNEGNKHSGNPVLDALQRLHSLLISGSIEIVDTPIEVEFLLKHCHDSIDTTMEINTLIDNIRNNIPNVANKPELKTKIEKIIDTLEGACQQNRPGLG